MDTDQEESKNSNISFSDLEKGWFTVHNCYQSVEIHRLPRMEQLNSKEKHLIAMAFYSILYLGQRPQNFPEDLGGALAILLYNNLLYGRMFEKEKKRTFLEPEGLPADVQEQFTPKCGIPSKLMDTASCLKAWACDNISALDADVRKAFEDRGTQSITQELAKMVGEAVAQQIHPKKGARKNREHVALLSASVFHHKEEDSLISLLAFFLRLVVQTPKQLVDYYANAKKRDEMVSNWAALFYSKPLIKGSICRKLLPDIHRQLMAIRPAITHHVAIGLAHAEVERGLEKQQSSGEDSAKLAYQELTKWFALRMENYGLALLEPRRSTYPS